MFNTILSKVAIGSIAATASVGIFASSSQAANLGGYNFEASNGTPSGVATGLTFTNFTYFGSSTASDNFPVGYNPSNPPQFNGGKSYSANEFSPDNLINTLNSSTDGYFQFGISANPGYSFSLASLGFVTQPNGAAAPTNIQLRSSLDNFATALFDGALGAKNVWTPGGATPLNLNSLTNITLRLYPYGENNNNGAKNLDIDNVSVEGSVTAVPTPALLPGLVGLGAGLLRKRKQAAIEG
jgi:hypothetical protein